MTYKVIFDEMGNPTHAEAWPDLTELPISEDSKVNGYKVDGYSWIDSQSEEEALEKAKYLKVVR